MKVVIDTNVWISILLSPGKFTTNWHIQQSFLEGVFTVVVPEETIDEIRGATKRRKWLADRIAPDAVEALVALFYERATVVPRSADPEAQIVRDVKDDYLILAARKHKVDILVSGDDDLFAHAGKEAFIILSPPAFVAALQLLTGQ